jgi:hypothetical protein
MVPILSLWLPLLLSAVAVFVASSMIHMLLGYHAGDFRKLPQEGAVLEALRPFAIPPADYMMPCASSSKEMKDPAYLDTLKQGPVGVFTILPNGPFSMGRSLVLWFLYSLVVSLFAAYVAGRALPAGSPFLAVLRFAGATAFLAYAFALWHDSIWYGRSWITTLKFQFDGLIYALLTGSIFGALWPS